MGYGTDRLGWEDLLGQLVVRGTGTATPTYSQIGATGMYAYDFVGTDVQLKEAFMDFHVNHRYKSGGDMHIHFHWLPDTTGTGNVRWFFQIAYARGYNREVMSVGSLKAFDVITAAPAIQYQHMISEVQISNNGGTGGLFDSNVIETDAIFMVRVYRDPADGSDTYAATAWGLYCDIHYQTDKMNTLNRNFPFE